MVYIDNEGSKFFFDPGLFEFPINNSKLYTGSDLPGRIRYLPWFSTVPSASNLADFPSRLKDHPLLKRDLSVSDGEVKDAFSGSMSFIEQARAPQ